MYICRYARINPLKATTSDVKTVLAEEGWREVYYSPESTSHEDFLDLISNLGSTDYLSDLHLPDLLVFPPQTPLYQHSLVTEGRLLLQDKASCLPVACLDPPSGASLLDACAAPGMKTSQAAGAVGKSGKVIAVERSTKRAGTLREILAKSDGNTVTTVLESDFLDVKPEEHPDVEYLVVDPSCSGTGMVLRPGDASDPPQERLDKLAGLQTRLLLHALSFPRAKKVVYSTCATSLTENEAVVAKVLSTSPEWKSVPALESWPRRGNEYQGQSGGNFLRAEPSLDFCNGFFVALLKRRKKKSKSAEQDSATQVVELEEVTESASKKKKKRKVEEDTKILETDCHVSKKQKSELPEAIEQQEELPVVIEKKKKKKHSHDDEETKAVIEESTDNWALKKKSKKASKEKKAMEIDNNGMAEEKKKKKKSKKSHGDDDSEQNIATSIEEGPEKLKKKKKKKSQE